jgi:acyl-CoA-dependent ceramide synthase
VLVLSGFLRTTNRTCFAAFSLRILLLPIFLHIIWTLFTPLILSHPPPSPLSPLLFISHPTPSPTDDSTDPRYRKGWLDLLFIAYYVVFFSFVRQSVLFRICYPIARYCGIRKRETLARFGEQGYAIFYFSFFGAWGLRIMSRLPTWWYNCPHFWIGTYVVGNLNLILTTNCRLPALADDSRTEALLSHAGVLLVSPTYRPRPSSREAPERLQGTRCTSHRHSMAHRVCPRFCVHSCLSIYTTVPRWSYGINLTLIGNAVYASMDIPDFFFAMSKLFNYLSWKRTQNIMFIIFVGVWT